MVDAGDLKRTEMYFCELLSIYFILSIAQWNSDTRIQALSSRGLPKKNEKLINRGKLLAVVGREGIEPSRTHRPGDFKSPASTISPPPHAASIVSTCHDSTILWPVRQSFPHTWLFFATAFDPRPSVRNRWSRGSFVQPGQDRQVPIIPTGVEAGLRIPSLSVARQSAQLQEHWLAVDFCRTPA